MQNTTTAQFASDVALVRSLAATNTPLGDILTAMRDTGRTEAHIAAVLAEAATPAERPAAPADEKLAVWSLIRRDAQDTVEPGDYVQMFVVAQSAEAARSWAYRRAVLDNKPAERVWLDSTGHDLLVSCFDAEVDADAETGVRETVVWQG